VGDGGWRWMAVCNSGCLSICVRCIYCSVGRGIPADLNLL